MKRLSWLLLAAILTFSTLGFAPLDSAAAPASSTTSGPVSGAEAQGLAAYIPGFNIVCHEIRSRRVCVSVSEARVRPGSSITIYGLMRYKGAGVPGQIMRVVWASNVTATCIGVTDSSGLASCTTYVPSSTRPARQVRVKVWVDKFKLLTSFITKRPIDLESID